MYKYNLLSVLELKTVLLFAFGSRVALTVILCLPLVCLEVFVVQYFKATVWNQTFRHADTF